MKQSVKPALYAALIATACSGCASQNYRAAVDKFGSEAVIAMAGQAAGLTHVQQIESDRIRTNLINEKQSLALSASCGIAAATPNERFDPCKITLRAAGGGPVQTMETVVDVSSIIKLQNALADYGKNLALLSQSANDDNEAFTKAATNLGVSVGKLDAAIAGLAQTERVASDEKLGLIASAISKIAGYVFAYQRTAALKRIVRETDTFVQEASGLLAKADPQIDQVDASRAFDETRGLMIDYNRLNAAPNKGVPERRAALNKFMGSVEALNLIANRTHSFSTLGKVHAALATASRTNASREELATAMKALISWNNAPSADTRGDKEDVK